MTAPDPTATLSALRDLEGEFHAAVHMLGIASDRVESMISRPPDMTGGGGGMYRISEDDRDRTLFSVFEAQNRIELLRERVFSILWPEPVGS